MKIKVHYWKQEHLISIADTLVLDFEVGTRLTKFHVGFLQDLLSKSIEWKEQDNEIHAYYVGDQE